MAKLTLNADPEVVELAKKLAAERGTSVSALFSDFVHLMARRRERGRAPLGPLTRQAIGIVSLPADKSDRELIEDALEEGHGS